MLSRRASRTPAAPVGSLAVLELMGARFAIPAAQILEIARIGSYTPLPCEDPTHLGVVLHRDAIVPLVDLGRALRARPVRAAIPGLCVFARTTLRWGRSPFRSIRCWESSWSAPRA
jgi:hypothetical protein